MYDEHDIPSLLALCDADPWLKGFAADLLIQYGEFARNLRRHLGTREEKQAVADNARNTLKCELLKLLEARDKATAVTPPTPPAEEIRSQQPTPDE